MAKIVFIVVSYNSESYLDKCIQSVLGLRTRHQIEVVVVDNGSRDDSVKIASSYPSVNLVELGENTGFGFANNRGAESVAADYYFLLNADAFFGEFWLDRMLDLFEADSTIALSSTRLAYPDGSTQTSAFSYSSPLKWAIQVLPGFSRAKKMGVSLCRFRPFRKLLGELGESYLSNHETKEPSYVPEDAPWVSGAALLVSGAYYRAHGLFDENIFLYGEDEDLCLEAKSRGWRVVVQNTHPVLHVHGWNTKSKYSPVVAGYKEVSLRYFIDKRFPDRFSRAAMRFLLPVYVHGWLRHFASYARIT